MSQKTVFKNWAWFQWTKEQLGTFWAFARIELAIPKEWGYSGSCTYTFGGIGKVTNNQIVYNGAETFEGTGSFVCPKKPKFSATFNITTPKPLYVTQS